MQVEKLAGSCDLTDGSVKRPHACIACSVCDSDATGVGGGTWTWEDWEATLHGSEAG
jgi:hypothetical protein